jgi:hypothetical protein
MLWRTQPKYRGGRSCSLGSFPIELLSSFSPSNDVVRFHKISTKSTNFTMFSGFKIYMLDMRPNNEVLVPSILVILGAFASTCLSSTSVYLIEQAVCRKHFVDNNLPRTNGAGSVAEESCKIPNIQARVASINGIYMFLAFLPGKWLAYGLTKCKVLTSIVAFFFTGPYRQVAKVLGRKIVIFMNICGFAIDSCFFIAVCE